ncbi:winged helix-turn-helix domain-containing protein [Natrarchaeobaculum aegyptiacum]|uniref:Transcriptional regulator n=1 Tax=Natrarchaeobaculum aegyptiacum TaxID=745377 RepID=A0A2Z2HRT2_9EURY|nr:helix-turn-helix domain-containing protein [Natrarchaeobaculum aegyptiacum]ARS89493.1 transcriptional regulator [Natrarchaeobaculum aegyptiacum]
MTAMNPTAARGWGTDDDQASPAAVLTALEDDACRLILEATADDALTATEISERCDIPMSTAYRKVEMLAEADLVDERVRINTTGKHATEYRTSFDDVVVSIADGGLEVEIATAEGDADAGAGASFATADD